MAAYTPDPANRSATVPLPTDLDLQRAATYNAALQQLADNQAFAGEQFLGGTVSAMRAMLNAQAGDLWLVREATRGGLYRCYVGTETMGAPWEYQSIGTPTCLWRHTELTATLDADRALARVGPVPVLDPDVTEGKLPTRNLTNWTRMFDVIGGTARLDMSVAANNTDYATDYITTIAGVVAGDTIIGQLDVTTAGDGRIYVELVCDVGGTPQTVNMGTIDIAPVAKTGGAIELSMSFAGIATASGTAQIKVHVIAPTDQPVYLWGLDGSGLTIGRFWSYRP
jgi:hypothetical protein